MHRTLTWYSGTFLSILKAVAELEEAGAVLKERDAVFPHPLS